MSHDILAYKRLAYKYNYSVERTPGAFSRGEKNETKMTPSRLMFPVTPLRSASRTSCCRCRAIGCARPCSSWPSAGGPWPFPRTWWPKSSRRRRRGDPLSTNPRSPCPAKVSQYTAGGLCQRGCWSYVINGTYCRFKVLISILCTQI